jgi:hypothetical protein
MIIVDDSNDLFSAYEQEFRIAGLRIVAKFQSGKDAPTISLPLFQENRFWGSRRPTSLAIDGTN